MPKNSKHAKKKEKEKHDKHAKHTKHDKHENNQNKEKEYNHIDDNDRYGKKISEDIWLKQQKDKNPIKEQLKKEREMRLKNQKAKSRDKFFNQEELERKPEKLIVKKLKKHNEIPTNISYNKHTKVLPQQPKEASAEMPPKNTNIKNTNAINITNNNDNKVVKKALLIGINYFKTEYELSSCISDTENLKNFLIHNKYFTSEEIITMTDQMKDTLYPTKANILIQLNNLVVFATNNKDKKVLLFILYSGHGSNMNKKDDDVNEVWCPVDFNKAGFIGDDDIRKNIINKLPANVKIVLLSDSYHCGSVIDLKYIYKVDNKNMYTVVGNLNPTQCDITVISSCKNNNNTKTQYKYTGAICASFIANYKDNITYTDLITNMRKWLNENKYDQNPQLSSGKQIALNQEFLLSSYDLV